MTDESKQPGPEDDRDPLTRRLATANKSLSAVGGRMAGAGLTFGVSLVVFTLLGVWLDSLVSTSPLFLLLGLALGGVGGFIHLVETVSPGTLFRSRRPERLNDSTPTSPTEPDSTDSDDDDPA